jgi:hypothetical protein
LKVIIWLINIRNPINFDLTKLDQALAAPAQWVKEGLATKADAQSTASALSDLSNRITLVSHATLPGIIIELAHSSQANGGRGIDKGGYYQLDFRVGSSSFNDFSYTQNADGTITLPDGMYLVTRSAKIIAESPDSYPVPAQVSLAVGQNIAFPGIYQYAVQSLPQPSQTTQSVNGAIGVAQIGGCQHFSSMSPVWMGFRKVTGVGGVVLLLQGYITILRIG